MRGGPGSAVSATVRPGALRVNRTLFRGSLSLMIQTHGTFWFGVPGSPTSGFAHTAFTWNALLPSSPIPTFPSKCKRTSAGATQMRSLISARCPCGSRRGAACLFGFQPAGSLSPGLAPAWREQGPQGKGCRCPLWQRGGSDGRPPCPGALLSAVSPPSIPVGTSTSVPTGPAAQPRPGCSNSRHGFTCSQFWRLDVQGGACSSRGDSAGAAGRLPSSPCKS